MPPRTAFEDRYLAEARRICLQEIPDPRYEIFLFGSRARGHCDHSSDGMINPMRSTSSSSASRDHASPGHKSPPA